MHFRCLRGEKSEGVIYAGKEADISELRRAVPLQLACMEASHLTFMTCRVSATDCSDVGSGKRREWQQPLCQYAQLRHQQRLLPVMNPASACTCNVVCCLQSGHNADLCLVSHSELSPVLKQLKQLQQCYNQITHSAAAPSSDAAVVQGTVAEVTGLQKATNGKHVR